MKPAAKRLDEIFEEQKQLLSAVESAAQREECPFIRFTIGGSVFAVGIDKVVEVTDHLQIVPYPETHFGHLGIVNLRGHIIPVLAFADQLREDKPAAHNESRLLVLEFAPGRRFCTPVSAPKKVSLAAQDQQGSDPRLISIDGLPARIVLESDFPATREAGIEGGQ